MKKIALIGGGIIGQFTAYYLSQSGHAVTIIDDSPEMPPASAGNCGLITPSHIFPLNSWSTIWQGIKWLGKENAPLSLKPQFNQAFISWFLSFAKHSGNSSINKAAKIRHELLQLSFALYKEFFNSEINNSEWKTDGLLFASRTPRGMGGMKHEVEQLKKYGLKSRLLLKQELLEMEPMINQKAIGGAIFNTDGWLNPTQLLADIRDVNSKNGVGFVKANVLNFIADKRVIKSLNLPEQSFEADEYILCAGAKSIYFLNALGINLNMIPGKGYNLTANIPLPNQPKRPIVMVEKMVVFTPWETGFRLGSTMEFSGFNLSLNEKRLNALRDAASNYLNIDLKDVKFTPWAGWRPMTSNSLPMIQRTPKFKNLIIATGHGMLGLSMAPATGKIVSELISAP
ncbi:MAG: FAD-dependent oxidoreductase [Cytophagales bacterium]|nr:FAD-dependent oxidoreductase [Cytophagales bacterium]